MLLKRLYGDELGEEAAKVCSLTDEDLATARALVEGRPIPEGPTGA
jgi:hypothetical protein